MSAEIKFVVVEICTSPWSAHITRALLNSEGIYATLAYEHHIGAKWPLSLALGGVRVLVPATSLDAAREVFTLRDNGVLQQALQNQWPSDEPVCANCGAAALIEKNDWASVISSAVLLFWCNAPFPPRKIQRCSACG